MKRAGVIGLGMALAIEVSGCSAGNTAPQPTSTKPACMHRIGSVLLNASDEADIIKGSDPSSLRVLESKPADGILLEAPASANQTELSHDDAVIAGLHKFITANADATFSKQTSPDVLSGDLRVTTFEHAPDSACATTAPTVA